MEVRSTGCCLGNCPCNCGHRLPLKDFDSTVLRTTGTQRLSWLLRSRPRCSKQLTINANSSEAHLRRLVINQRYDAIVRSEKTLLGSGCEIPVYFFRSAAAALLTANDRAGCLRSLRHESIPTFFCKAKAMPSCTRGWSSTHNTPIFVEIGIEISSPRIHFRPVGRLGTFPHSVDLGHR